MPSLLVRLLVTVCCLLAMSSQAANPSSGSAPAGNDVIVLDDRAPPLQISTDVSSWVDEGSNANIEQVVAGMGTFMPQPALTRYPLNKFDTVWIKLRVQRTHASKDQ